MSSPATDLAPVVEDLSAYVISGAVSAEQKDVQHASDCRTPRQGIEDVVEAERLGFRMAWLSERWDIKQADVILSAAAERTSRIHLGTGMVLPATRDPWLMAAFAATMQVCHGDRFTLGLGRGDNGILRDMGLKMTPFAALEDYVGILRRLWAGETVTYDGPAGTYPALEFSETYGGPPPPVTYGAFARPKGADLIARCFDGVVLPPILTPDATAKAVERLRLACEKVGRDPAELRVVQCVVTTPGLSEVETRSLAHGRAVGYLQYVGYGEILVEENGWDPSVLGLIRGHEQMAADDKVADRRFHRHELLGPAGLVPDEWMQASCAIGSVEQCVDLLQRFRDAGADEIATYGSTPAQNAGLVDAWRARPAAAPTAPAGVTA